ncbi:MAG TPA: glycoside hydrolase family 30 beta sandwich domain-containing protein [Acidobacteriaceae bacterium]|jgi:glucosylceramidase|nr:glycoside hydrolase family 30 beta sandwich domain-containing protein [Acidobacteriaceae bacterium]
MLAKSAFLLLILSAATPFAPAQDAHLWLTTSSRSALLAPQPDALHFSATPTSLPVIDVNNMQQYQSMQGFGFALTGGSAQLLMAMSAPARAALLHELFNPSGDGIHVSYLRVSIGSSDMNDHAYTYDDLPPGQTDPQLAHFSLDIDRPSVIAALKEILAINPHIMILGSPWSAPAWMKTNDALKGGHLKPDFYAAYAQYFVKYIEGMAAEGIHLTAITIQNEPLNPKNTPSLVMFAAEEADFIAKALGPAFENAGIHTVIEVYDHNPDVPSYPLAILADPAASRYVAGTAFHLYGGDASAFTRVHELYPNKDLFMTEQSVTQTPHVSGLDIDEPVQRVIIESTRNWARNVLLWNLAADPNAGPHTNDGGCTSCYGALTIEGNRVTRNVAYYVLAHASEFVPPGSIRIGSSALEQLDNVAFETPEGKVVIIIANTGNFAAHFAVRFHGQSIEPTLPEESVGTFVW